MEERFHIPLLLCCAEENEVALVRVVDELHKEGCAPEVVAGVDLDGSVFSSAVDRTDGPALFVLCQTDELNRTATRKLSGLFSARKAPDHRIITVSLTPNRPMSILPPIRTALRDVMRARYESDPDPAGGAERVFMRDVVGPTGVSATGPQEPDAEAMARRLHQEMVAAEKMLTRRDRIAKAAAPATPPASGSDSGEPGAPQVVMDDEEARPRSLMPDLERLPEGGLRTDAVPTEMTPTEHRVKRRSLSVDPRPESVTTKETDRPGNRVLLFVAIAGITALALMAVLQMSGGVDDSARADPGVPASTQRGLPPSRGPAVADQKGVAPATKAAPATKNPPDVADGTTPPDSAEGGSAPPDPDGGRADGGPTPSVPPPPPNDIGALVIDRAIADGKIRALDNLLVLSSSRETMTWSEASRMCRARSVVGIKGWHLPSSLEMKRLRRSRMLGAATYWTRQRNSAKDEAHALDNRTGRINLYLVVERIGRPICVRRR